MYSDAEIETAVSSGAIDRETAERLRANIASQRHSLPADDEMIRLVTGFNDIFVTIAAALVIFAAWKVVGGIAAAIISWGLAEYFTRKKKMALPSIFLLLCFAAGIFSTLAHLAYTITLPDANNFTSYGSRASSPPTASLIIALSAAGLLTAAAIVAHWKRFHVPITIAALTAALAMVAGCFILLILHLSGISLIKGMVIMPWIAFIMGLVIFAYAMRWDLKDPERVTRRSDVAFWLHLTASPLIVHPLFMQLAVIGSDSPGSRVIAALLAILLYGVLALFALIVDRRAVLVSALAYVVIAMGVLMRANGEIGSTIVMSGAVIGALLLALSVFWRSLRQATVRLLPEAFQLRLPK